MNRPNDQEKDADHSDEPVLDAEIEPPNAPAEDGSLDDPQPSPMSEDPPDRSARSEEDAAATPLLERGLVGIRQWGRRVFGPDEEVDPDRPSHRREFVVIGLGRFGLSVAQSLHRYGHDVLAIDSDGDRVQKVSSTLPHVVQLDATNEEGLHQLGVGSFDTGLVSIGTDFESNLMATVLLLRAGVRRVITKARTRTQRDILERIGAHQVILPEHEAGLRLARRLAHLHIVDYLEVSEDVDVVECVAPSFTWNRTLRETALRQEFGLSVIAIRRGDETIVNPRPSEPILRDDILVVVGRIEDAEELSR